PPPRPQGPIETQPPSYPAPNPSQVMLVRGAPDFSWSPSKTRLPPGKHVPKSQATTPLCHSAPTTAAYNFGAIGLGSGHTQWHSAHPLCHSNATLATPHQRCPGQHCPGQLTNNQVVGDFENVLPTIVMPE